MFRDRLPYICIAMYYIEYLSQTISLYLFTCLSVVRLYAVVSPLQHRCGSTLGKLKCLVVVLAVTIGSACATLNLASILTLQDIAAKKTCRLSVSDSVRRVSRVHTYCKSSHPHTCFSSALSHTGMLKCSNHCTFEGKAPKFQ